MNNQRCAVKNWALATVGVVLSVILLGAASHAGDVYINQKFPIRGKHGSALSPPHVEPTNECAAHVYVDSIVPGATIRVYLNGPTLIGGPVVPQFDMAFGAVPLTHALHTGDKITATQTVNGTTSARSAVMVVGNMPATLDAPGVGDQIYACGRVVPVTGLVSGVKVEVRDDTAATTIGSGSTPNDWGNDWDPVVTSSLTAAHEISARQLACTGIKSPFSSPQIVQADPAPVPDPSLDPPIVGNNAITAHHLLTGSDLKAFDHATVIGNGLSTGETNWMGLSQKIQGTSLVSADQTLCSSSGHSPPVVPVSHLPPPKLVGPICPHQPAAFVADSTINATLVLLKNGIIVGYGGAAPGEVPLDLAPGAKFNINDKVRVAEYIGSIVAYSNTVTVGCHDVLTYHNDSQRTGWNPRENTLTPGNVTPSTFGLIATATLDDDNDQVDAQPLIVTGQAISGTGVHSVAYVVTENNSVYAIDAFSGATLQKVNLGTPVPQPLNCENNGPTVGINGTPTIDLRTRTLYVIAYVLMGTTPVHELHALDLATLQDRAGSPVTVSANDTLQDGSPYSFDSSVQRQRPALLQANGRIYAGFGSFCDFKAAHSRGWVLGWNQTSLVPLVHAELLNKAISTSTFDCYFHAPWTSNHPCYLSSVWMSGFGLASDPGGDLFFTTGNTAPGIYDRTTNLAESVIRLAPDLGVVRDFFTPWDENGLDGGDTDYGSGGTLVLPDQPGPVPHLAVAAGKEGNLFIVNRDVGKMGEFQNPNVPSSVPVDYCWCGPSYFTGADGVGRVVSSGGSTVRQWTVNTSNTPALALEGVASVTVADQDPGFFTSISSNGTTPNTAIIWAVDRPVDTDHHVTLYAFDATASGGALKQLWVDKAGTWPNGSANANIVPTVANGMVYVASYKQLRIFGLVPRHRWPLRLTVVPPRPEMRAQPFGPPSGPLYWGVIRKVEGSRVTLELRTGRMLAVDMSKVAPHASSDFGAIGRAFAVGGTLDADGVLLATDIWRAKGAALWDVDRDK
jgi:hypothetical protein